MAVQASPLRATPSPRRSPTQEPVGRRRSSSPRTVARLGLVALVLLVVCAASLTIGARSVGVGTMIDAVTAFDPANGDHAVVLSRVPRTVIGLLVGAALAAAGAALQGIARNPLADPGILGINAGAALAVVVGIYVFGLSSASGYIWFAFVGAAAAALVVYAVASIGREGATPVKLALAGAALAAGLASLTNAVLVSSQETLDTFRFWQVGTLSGRGWDVIGTVSPFLLVGLVLTLATGKLLNSLALGDDVARALGQNVGLARGLAALGVVILCGAATAAAGPIGFVGLVIPHMVRLVVGADYRWILPFSALLGPVLLLSADIIGRVVLPPGEVQVGIMTAVVGAPVFIWLVRRRRMAQL
ncbi:iron chelate uptake ABC transporter family permease subunit [Arthrobacter agilis]|uniref:FecCD family ABC transporter permease n=1 Tax=Arthrobacter agilis TaxID=37921 RepID=UPI000B35ED7D|nr:iron chelate uptake ABC transporter family permease subunit [Arthrobacter agilis]OUM43143.1 iron ABC transporter permease [Arthrobacter agilis]PPB46087.1 iron ABC transporter permease [Arthrobacter agilis]TPV25628.1 iron chelate uptake ABC transporter family permease subunit [Arthrobacter agilis]VDR33403.1 Probable siderophore transport system permease protein yfiZ precursor [Arthrobacter agilis]